MRIPSIWYKHTEEIVVDKWEKVGLFWKVVGKMPSKAIFYGGSNISEEEAKANALKKRDIVQSRIDGVIDRRSDPDYEVDIREEIIGTVDDENIITRNRYGSLVLNSTSLVIVDVDDESFRWRYRWSFNLFTILRNLFISRNFRDLIESETKRVCRLYASKSAYVRLYRTPNGYRVILVFENSPEPASKESKIIMKRFRSDYTYANMCIKQRCYRARLTPKPWRIKLKSLKAIFPFRTAEEDVRHQEWVTEYHQVSENFAACRLMESFGSARLEKALDYHDKFCKALSDLPLA